MAAAGRLAGMVALGRVISEEPGAREVAEWLRTFVTDVPVDFVSAGEPFAAV